MMPTGVWRTIEYGFVRAPNGTFTTLDFGSGGNTGAARGINPAGEIAGNYSDANGGTHGFVRIPAHQDDDTEGLAGGD